MPAKGMRFGESKYTDTMPEELVACFAKGMSRTAFCAKKNIGQTTFDLWRRKYPEFQKAYEIGMQKSAAWWEAQAQDNLITGKDDPKLNHTVWSMNMRNRFLWTEHRAIEVPGLAKAKTFTEKFDIIAKCIESGMLTSSEAASLSAVLTAGVKIAESSEMLARIEQLEKMLEAKQQDETFS